ncbi:stage III sporulation protein AD [Numidum massiliense]|uniref:stage III sporulation protein AD n=1 Tax=Numidum massiliense TaxID=1522315 RepID=UPI0006D54B7D|nr:stage III sporulation protein AD [Numidum massiliense]
MDILQIIGLGLITTFLVLVIKERQPLFALLLATFVGAAIFLSLIGEVGKVITLLQDLANKANVDTVYLATILKIIGIAYIVEFAVQIMRDAGQGAIAQKVELAGKIVILVMAIPILTVLVETIIQLFPQ